MGGMSVYMSDAEEAEASIKNGPGSVFLDVPVIGLCLLLACCWNSRAGG